MSVFVAPMAYLGYLSVTEPAWGPGNYVRLVEEPSYLKIIALTIRTALGVTVMSLLLGYPVAYRLSAVGSRIANLLLIAVVLPYFVSYLIRTYSWMVILGREGVINRSLLNLGLIGQPLKLMFNMLGVYIAMVHIMTPIMILVLYGVMRGIDRNLLLAARSMGASPFAAFVRIFLPLSMPGVGSACLLVLILSTGFYITPTLLGSQREVMIASLIMIQVNQLLNWGFAAALSIVTLLIVGLTYVILRPVAGFERAIDSGQLSESIPHPRVKQSQWGKSVGPRVAAIRSALADVAVTFERLTDTVISRHIGPNWLSWRTVSWVFSGLVLLYLVAPVLVVVPLSLSSASYLTFPPPGFSLRWYQRYLDEPTWIAATIFSLKIGALAVGVALVLGLMATVALVRSNVRGKRLLFALFLLPIVVPEIITAVGIYFVFARVGLTDNLSGFVIAHSLLAIPFIVVVVAPALKGLDIHFEQAARNLGAGPLTVFRRITLPLLRTSIIAGALFGFLASFDNLLVALFLSGPDAVTLPIKMWQEIRLEINPVIAAVSTLEVLLAGLVMVAAGQVRLQRTQPRDNRQ